MNQIGNAGVGLPTVRVTGYTAYEASFGTPGRRWFEAYNAKVSLNLVRGRHTINLGGEYNTRSAYASHGAFASRGQFFFNSQYTGDAFADYFLGLVQRANRNFPLQTFGMSDSPYSGIYVNDAWKISDKLTVNLGLRYDYWYEKAAVRGNHVTFDRVSGLAVAGEDKKGNVDLTSQPVSEALAKFTEGLWAPASQLGIPSGLFKPDGVVSPRVGIAYRPTRSGDIVIRAGYGLFPMHFAGNRTASAIAGPPYFSVERIGFSRASNQRWETAFPDDPNRFLAQAVVAPAWDVRAQRTHEWNTSIQFVMPARSALTLSYVGNYSAKAHAGSYEQFNDPPPGFHQNLQSDRPFPRFGNITLLNNFGHTWYNALHAKWERRFTDGWLFTMAYAWGKYLEQLRRAQYAPTSYNRGRNIRDRNHLFAFNSVYELPIGRGRKWMSNGNSVVNGLLGGWQISGIYRLVSGAPLSMVAPGATLGNGRNSRADVVGEPRLSNPTAAAWFNVNAFARPDRFTFGNSARGILDGPGEHVFDFALMKNFYVSEGKYVQFRWEMFNLPNHVNLGDPLTFIGLPGRTGVITSARDARQMQFGLKFVF